MSQSRLTQGIAPSHTGGHCTVAIKIKFSQKKRCGHKTSSSVWRRITKVCVVWWKSRAPVPMLNPRMRLRKASAVKRAAVGTFQLTGIESQFGNFLPGSTRNQFWGRNAHCPPTQCRRPFMALSVHSQPQTPPSRIWHFSSHFPSKWAVWSIGFPCCKNLIKSGKVKFLIKWWRCWSSCWYKCVLKSKPPKLVPNTANTGAHQTGM